MSKLRNFALGVIFSFVAACAPVIATTTSLPPQPPIPVLPTEASTTLTLTRTPNPFPNPVLKIIGSEEVVFDWTKDSCEEFNIPDLPVRAFRDANGNTQLILSMIVNYRMIGPDPNHLKTNCNPLLTSQHNPAPSFFSDAEWIASPYTEDGQTVYAIIHDEYHGWEHPEKCSKKNYFPPCWYNALTLAISTDGGQTYAHAGAPPEHLIASLPYPYKEAAEAAGAAGPRNPSNIIKGKDGNYYMFANLSYYEDQWVCLMRSSDLSDPKSWRFWDGKAFDGEFANPYESMQGKPDSRVCPALARDNIGHALNDSITYNMYLNRYVLVGISADTIGGREIWGFYYSFSDDLVHWTRRKLLTEMVLPWTAKNNNDIMYLYPSLIDPASDSRNFETTGKTAYLYYTRHNFGQGSLDRDLVRVPVEFFPSP